MDHVTLFHVRTVVMILAIALAFATFLLIPRPRPVAFRVIGLITGLALVSEVMSYSLSIRVQNNTWVYNIFTTVEFLLLMRMALRLRPAWRFWLVGGVVVGMTALVANAIVSPPSREMLTEGIVAISFIAALVIGALLWSMAMTSEVALHRVPEFWLFMGSMLYFSALPPVVLLAWTFTEENPSLMLTLWTIMPVLCIVRYLLAAYANRMQARGPAMHG